MSDSTPPAPSAPVDPPAPAVAATALWPTPLARLAVTVGGTVPGTLDHVLAQARAGDSAALARYLVLRRNTPSVRQA